MTGRIVEFTTGVYVTDKNGNFIGQYEFCGDETDDVIITNDTIISAFIILDNGDSIVAHNITDFCNVSLKTPILHSSQPISCSYKELPRKKWKSIYLCEHEFTYAHQYNEDDFQQVLLNSCYISFEF